MFTFITDVTNDHEDDILSEIRFERLIIMSLDGQYLSRYDAPANGWTHSILVRLSHFFPSQWNECGADALLGNTFVGSTEI